MTILYIDALYDNLIKYPGICIGNKFFDEFIECLFCELQYGMIRVYTNLSYKCDDIFSKLNAIIYIVLKTNRKIELPVSVFVNNRIKKTINRMLESTYNFLHITAIHDVNYIVSCVLYSKHLLEPVIIHVSDDVKKIKFKTKIIEYGITIYSDIDKKKLIVHKSIDSNTSIKNTEIFI